MICDCSSAEHQIIFHYDEEEKLVYCSIHLSSHNFFKRLKLGLRYIFGYKCRFGHWEEFILKTEHSNKLKEISDFLSNDDKS